jgi:hypothetical protein
MAAVITGDTRDLFVAIATAAATLTGLLFVAMTVSPRPEGGRPHGVIHQVRSAAALLAFTNPLAVTLFGLVPNDNAGYASAALGTVGTLFSLASVRSILTDPGSRPRFLSQVPLVLALLAVFVTEIVYGIELAENHHNANAINTIGNVLIASTLIGIARAWEFVGDRDTGLWSSIAVLATGRNHPLTERSAEKSATGASATGAPGAGERRD